MQFDPSAEADLAWTLAVVEGRSVDDVVRAYRGESVGAATFVDSAVPEEDFGEYFHVQVFARGAHVLAVENNGWCGSSPTIACAASIGGRFLSVYWAPENFSIHQAINGDLTAAFDPVMVGLPAGERDLHPDWITGVDFRAEPIQPLCLALVEQQTGLAFDRRWLDVPWPTYRVRDVD